MGSRTLKIKRTEFSVQLVNFVMRMLRERGSKKVQKDLIGQREERVETFNVVNYF